MLCEAARFESAADLRLPGAAEGVLRDNLARLASPELARRVLAAPLRHVALRRGPPVPAGLSLYGAAICSATAPESEAEAWAGGLELGGLDFGVLVGLGLGHALRALRRRTSIPLVVVEPSHEVLRLALSLAPLPHEEVKVVDGLVALREALGPRLAVRDVIGVLPWPAYRRLFPELVRAAHAAATSAACMASVTGQTLRKRLRHWTRNLLLNLPASMGRVPLSALDGRLRGYPAIVVAAGPSLDRNVAELRRARGRALVIAVNTSLRALERAGVAADLVAAVEVLDVTGQLAGLERNACCTRALDLTCHPALFERAEGPVLPFSDQLPFLSPIAAEAGLGRGLPMGGSVANAAFSIARLLGADPIVLVGQDLAYSDGRAYASGTVFERMRVRLEDGTAELCHLEAKRLIAASLPEVDATAPRAVVRPVVAWGGGGEVHTTLEFDYFRASFERLGRAAAGLTLINATEGGARIHGFLERRLAEVLDELPARELPPWHDAPVLEAAPLRRVLARELDRTRAACARLRGAEDLTAAQTALAASPLLQAYTWPTVQGVLDAGLPIGEVASPLASEATECLELIGSALARAGRP